MKEINHEIKDRRICENSGSISFNSSKLGETRSITPSETPIRASVLYREKSSGSCESGDYIEKPYGYIYITENLISHRKYIGMHRWSEYSLDENYLGSGVALRDAVKSYGDENFSCMVIEFCYSYEEMCEREKYWISYYNAVNSDEFYNLIDGGRSGICTYNSLSDEEKEVFRKRSSRNSKIWFSDEKNKEKWLKIIRSDDVRLRKIAALKRQRSTPEYKSFAKEKAAIYWTNPENIEAHKKLMVTVHNTPEAIENHRRAAIEVNSRPDVKERQKESKYKRVKCLELNMIFRHAQEALDYLGIKANNTSNIRNSANTYKHGKKYASAYGYHFIYVDD